MIQNLKSLKLMGEALISSVRRDEKGVTIVEYVVMVALVALAIMLAAPGISDAIIGLFDTVIQELDGLQTPPA